MKYSLTFALLGILTCHCSVSLGGLWYILFWFAISLFTLSMGYAGIGPRVFRKRPDGRIPLWVKIIHLPFFGYSAAVWYATKLISRENPYDKVQGDLILGRRLRADELAPDFANYVDLTAEFEDPKEIRESSSYICLPILDGDVPSPEDLISAISRLRAGTTYVHCAQGHGRTALFALALLSSRGSVLSFEDGFSLLKTTRPGIGLNKAQETFAKEFISKHCAPVKLETPPH